MFNEMGCYKRYEGPDSTHDMWLYFDMEKWVIFLPGAPGFSILNQHLKIALACSRRVFPASTLGFNI
eukprot:6805604-Karenia_brevis.AAC.1